MATRSEQPAELNVHLLLRAGEPVTGVLRAGEHGPAVEFCGWLELIAAITRAHEDHNAASIGR